MLKTHETEGWENGRWPGPGFGYASSHGDGVRRDALRV
jgi:hypothetical protein